jgi:2',3'-cyclic-nucleotide 2'-phosphodiesterase (5'-nucleotidase family)
MEAGVADLILSGHDHDLRILYDGRTAVVESASQASYVTAIDLVLDRIETNGRSRVTWHPSFRTLDSAAVEPDARGLELIKAYEGKLAAELDMVIGRTMTALDSRRGTVRAQEAAVGNLIADAMRTAVGADVAMTNGGGIRGDRVYEAGTVLTRRDIQRELPFGNRTVKLEVTGAELLAALENGFSRVEEEAGRFPQVSGMRVEVDLAKPGGARVQAVEVAGKPLEPEGRYILATNDYMARGGDGYEALASARRLVNEASARLLASQVIDHIAARGEVAARVEGRIIRAE